MTLYTMQNETQRYHRLIQQEKKNAKISIDFSLQQIWRAVNDLKCSLSKLSKILFSTNRMLLEDELNRFTTS